METDCIFCRIIRGELPAVRLYEDEELIIFLDAFPVARGHTLFVPKAHASLLDQLPEGGRGVLQLLPEAVAAVREMSGAEGINLWQNNGPVSGQAVPHVHFHLVPRFRGDGLFCFPPQGHLDAEEARELQNSFLFHP